MWGRRGGEEEWERENSHAYIFIHTNEHGTLIHPHLQTNVHIWYIFGVRADYGWLMFR